MTGDGIGACSATAVNEGGPRTSDGVNCFCLKYQPKNSRRIGPAGPAKPMKPTNTIVIVALCLSAWAFQAHAQGLTITSPSNGDRLKAGPDHFTDVVGDPMDFSNADDFMSENLGTSGWVNNGPMLSNGRLTGTTVGGDNAVMLVHPGFKPGSLNLPGFYGTETPIDTTRFQRLSFRVKSSNAADVPGIYIFRETLPSTGGGPTTYQPGPYGVTHDRIFNIDLTTIPAAGPAWTSSSEALGVRFDPNETGSQLSMELDWLRFTVADANSEAVSTPITWSGATGSVTIELLDATNDIVLETLATGLAPAAHTAFTWSYGYLAPGTYRLRVRDTGNQSATVSITINDPPVIHLTNPDQSGGEDWATAVKGNAWDMSSLSDIILSNNVVNLTSDGAVVQGTSPSGNGDPNLFLAHDDPNGIDSSYHRLTFRMRVNTALDLGAGSVARIIFGDVINDTSAPVTTTTQDIVVFDGFQSYFVDLSTLQFTTGLEPGSPANYKTWDEMGTIRQFRLDPHEFSSQVDFEIDDVKLAKDDETTAGLFGITWTVTDADAGDAPTVTLEYDNDTNAANGTLGQLATGLAAIGRGSFSWNTAGITPGVYYIRATVTDGRNSQSRYSTGPVRVLDPNAPANVTLTVGVSGGGTVTSNPAGITCGSDCLQVYTQGTNVALVASPNTGFVFAGWGGDAVCADGVVEMTANRNCTAAFTTVLPSPATPGAADFNGDHGGDALLYRPDSGEYRLELDTRAFNTVSGTWSPGWEIQAANFDGDGLTDLFFYNPSSGAWFKGFSNGAGGFTFFGGSWSPNWDVTILDLNGDGRSDVFLYNQTTGHWFRGTSLGDGRGDFAFIAGTWSPGWDVYVADWNGDNVDDLFVYNNATGTWVRITTVGDAFTYIGGSWSPNWTIHAGDYNGDGRSDLFLYNASSGLWFTALNNGSGFDYTSGRWSPSWVIKPGDLDADGRTDLFLYNATTGAWFMCFSDDVGGFSFSGGSWSPGWRVLLTDYNADGREDVLLYNATSGAYYQGTNTGPGTFGFQGGNWGLGWATIVAGYTTTP